MQTTAKTTLSISRWAAMNTKMIRAGHTAIKRDIAKHPAVNRPPGKKPDMINSGWRSSLLIILYTDARTMALIIITLSGRSRQVKHEISPPLYKCPCPCSCNRLQTQIGNSSASNQHRSLLDIFHQPNGSVHRTGPLGR